jgi:hypothetical protein
MKRISIAMATVALSGLICVVPAMSQAETASLSGSIQDANRVPLPGVTVTATYTDTDTKVTKVTDSAGKYSFTDLKPGNYLITASLAGFTTARAYATLTTRKGPEMMFVMKPEQAKPSAVR